MSDSQAITSGIGDSYPARLDVDYPEAGLSRVKTLFRIVLIRVCQFFCVTGRDGFHLMWSAIRSP